MKNPQEMTDDELQQEIKTWDGVNKYLYNNAKKEVWRRQQSEPEKPIPVDEPETPIPEVKLENYTKEQLLGKNRDEQIDICKEMGIKGYSKWNELKMVIEILKAQ